MRALFAVLGPAVLVACASTPQRDYPADGTYKYFAAIPGLNVKGTLHVIADTMLITSEGEPCGPAGNNNSSMMRFGCRNGVLLTVDRRNPSSSASWSGMIPVQRRREVCAETAMQNGRRVCLRKSVEVRDTTEWKKGKLQVFRADPDSGDGAFESSPGDDRLPYSGGYPLTSPSSCHQSAWALRSSAVASTPDFTFKPGVAFGMLTL
jgi:hypothetical protein